MTVGIDWVAVAVIGAALVFGQIRQVPGAVRYSVMAAAFAVVGAYRLSQSTRDGFNLMIVALCAIFCVTNLVKALRYREQG